MYLYNHAFPSPSLYLTIPPWSTRTVTRNLEVQRKDTEEKKLLCVPYFLSAPFCGLILPGNPHR